MKIGSQTFISAAILTAVTTSPAFADISTVDLKNQIVALYESVGYTVEIGAEIRNGDELRLEDISVTFDIPEDGGQMALTYEWVTLHQVGGDVEIVFPPSLGISGTSNADGDDVELSAHMELDQMHALVSGNVSQMAVAAAAAGGKFVLDSLVVDGKEAEMAMSMDLGSVAANVSLAKSADDLKTFSGDLSLDGFSLAANIQEPGGEGFLTVSASIDDVSSVISGAIPRFDDPEQFLKSGFAFSESVQFATTEIDFNFQDGNDRFAATYKSEGGSTGLSVSNEEIGFSIAGEGVSLNASSSELPIPAINLGYDEFSVSFKMPTAPGADGPSDFHARTALRGLTISEAIWSMFDPGQAIPRDPATVAVDLSGQLMVLANLMDPEIVDNLNGPPFLPVSIDLNELTASLGGALLTGNGGATFDFSNPNTIEGFPAPEAEVNLRLVGGFGLMDKLVGAGLVPQDASLGLRAMLGAFARPVGEDQLESKIEVTSEGAVLANGQRIK